MEGKISKSKIKQNIMLKRWILLFVALGSLDFASAQDGIAKIKFEAAEEAYSKEDYQSTIARLNEADEASGKLNVPKMLYLRILSEFNLFIVKKKTDLNNINIIKRDCKAYLRAAESGVKIEEKYNEIVNISEKLQFIASSIKLDNSSEFDKGKELYFAAKYGEAMPVFKSLAEQGHIRSMHFLGTLYYFGGTGLNKDLKESLKWYAKAADFYDTESYEPMGDLYFYGKDIPKNYSESFKWYKMSVDVEENARPVTLLARLYYFGDGVEMDKERAFYWFTKGAEKGDAVAQFALGGMYKDGDTVPANRNTAILWYKKAAAQNNKAAIEALKEKQ
jgi:tetratricopeptide (TPR) repeat protein